MEENKITLTDDFNIFNLIRNVWINRILFLAIIAAFGIGSIIYTLVVDEQYQVNAIIKPADPSEETTLNEASPIIGLSIGGYSHDPVINNILITLKSETFLEIFYYKYKDNEKLFESDPDYYSGLEPKQADEMMRYNALKTLHKVIDFQVNSDHNTIDISVKMKDKYFAFEFLNDFLVTMKDYISKQNMSDLESDFKFYKELSEKANDPMINQMLDKKMMEKAEKKFMLSSNVFRIVQKPAIPAKRVFPKRTFIVVITTSIGSLIALMIVSLKSSTLKIIKMLRDIAK